MPHKLACPRCRTNVLANGYTVQYERVELWIPVGGELRIVGTSENVDDAVVACFSCGAKVCTKAELQAVLGDKPEERRRSDVTGGAMPEQADVSEGRPARDLCGRRG